MAYEPNKYQEKILNWAKNGTGNALIEARAGCGKTSTLIMLANIINNELNQPCLFLAFNNHIAEEIKIKMADKIKAGKLEVRTVNSLGASFISSYLFLQHDKDKEAFEIRLDNKKMSTIGQKIIDMELTVNDLEFIDPDERNDMYWEFKTLCDLIRTTNIPYKNLDSVNMLMARYGIFESVSTHGLDIADMARQAIEEDLKMFDNPPKLKNGKCIYTIDYADQLFLPLARGMWAPGVAKNFGCSFILTDEAQDLSNSQHRLLMKCTTKKNNPRYIFVADESQAIYGFAGADTHSVEHLKEKFTLNYFPLNICYRCPKKHIQLIQSIVPDIEPNPNAIDGEIHIIKNSEIANLAQNGDYIIARKNKELVDIMLEILRQGKSIFVKDENLVKTTVSNIRKLNCKSTNDLKGELKKLQVQFQQQQKNPAERGSGSAISNDAADIYDSIFTLLDNFESNSQSKNTKDFIKYIEKILNVNPNSSSIVLSSVHGVKGGEADNVFVVSHNKFPYIDDRNTPDQNQQERNLEYIALSRAKKVMYLCQSEK